MSTENTTTPDVAIPDNLDDFSASFFGETKQTSEAPAKAEEEVELEQKADDANTEEVDTQSEETGDDDTPAPDDDDDETEQKAKPEKKNRLQERINELTAARREAERKLAEAEAKLAEKQTPKPEPAKAVEESKGPDPLAKNEDGSDKYPLGEFDPKFVKDTIQHALNEQAKAAEVQKAEQEKLSAEEQYRNTLVNSWNEKLEDVRERYPDYEEKGQEMLSVFEGIDQAYGQYLTDTLMEMDAGPEVFYYLANNLDEAERIVNAGPRRATIALAKIEAQLTGTKTKEAVVKTTNAPPPPPQLKGSAVAKASVPLDTDDLDAFSKQLFKKK
jgi:hypothetical protein